MRAYSLSIRLHFEFDYLFHFPSKGAASCNLLLHRQNEQATTGGWMWSRSAQQWQPGRPEGSEHVSFHSKHEMELENWQYWFSKLWVCVFSLNI